MKLLVHACCGPCSIMPTRLLVEQGHDITLFYANSNIAPQAEYEKRLRELKRYAESQGFRVMEGEYDPSTWEQAVAPIGEALKDFSPALSARQSDDGAEPSAPQSVTEPPAPQSVAELLDDDNRRERCRACYRLRLEEAATVAAQRGCDGLATTLAVSPYQFTDVIREELERSCGKAGIIPHFQDYRPYYDEATRISRELGMYRQNYCGCRFSVVEGEATRTFIKKQRTEAKAAKAQAHAMQRIAEAEARQKKLADKQAYANERARRRAILKELRNRS